MGFYWIWSSTIFRIHNSLEVMQTDAEFIVEFFTSKEWETARYAFLAECIGTQTNNSAEAINQHLDTLLRIRDILVKANGVSPTEYDRVCRCIQILEADLANGHTDTEE